MNVAIVTPWLDHPELANDYQDAVSCRDDDDELIVVDNGSDPPIPFATIRLEQNYGFALACNIGLRSATADAVLFLNNDIRMTSPSWLERLRHQMEPGVLVGARLRRDTHADVDGQLLPYLDGWCLGGMRDDLTLLEGFDTDYAEPAYYSDNDLCLRARADGMTLREVRVGLEHLENVTAGPASSELVRHASRLNRARYMARARELMQAVER